jgi:glycosyltransferase involved in cell wall biosynthesis
MHVSLIIPIYNEWENIPLLHQQITRALDGWQHTYEILCVDDGSTDGSTDRLRELATRDPRVKLVRFRRNYGQTAAMQAGIDHAAGDVLVTLDGDLQNDPADIPLLVARLEEGYDLVHGWRQDRQDAWLTRKLPSRIANWIISRATGFPIHDLGCTLKAIRRDIAADLELYGEMHRFIPILAHWKGARCLEVVTRHHPRRFGKTKYGLSRTLRVLLDLLTVQFLLFYSASPMKLFGMIGLGCGAVGVLSGLATIGMKLAWNEDMTGNPLLLLTALLAIVAVQFLSLGLLGEMCTRLYFGSQNRCHYTVRERVNIELPEAGERTTPPLRLHRRAA